MTRDKSRLPFEVTRDEEKEAQKREPVGAKKKSRSIRESRESCSWRQSRK